MLATSELAGEALSAESALTSDPQAEQIQCSVQPRRVMYLRFKNFGEWLTALVLLIIASPVMLVLAVLIKLTSQGPIIYAQTRLGRRGRHYRIFKFRSMVHDAERHTGPVWAAKEDGRVTKLGRILRNTHLDELPQLWNVLCRDMNLIGPRPERPEIAVRIERHVNGFANRLAVRPGITGFAQMLAPADDPEDRQFVGARRKLDHDLYYVRELSFMLDMRIALCTACFFTGSAIDCIQNSVMRAHRLAIGRVMADADDAEASAERAA